MTNTATTTEAPEVEAIKAAWRGLRQAISDWENTPGDKRTPERQFAMGRMSAYGDMLKVLTGRTVSDVFAVAKRRAIEDGLISG